MAGSSDNAELYDVVKNKLRKRRSNSLLVLKMF
jgi:hypothetical protein